MFSLILGISVYANDTNNTKKFWLIDKAETSPIIFGAGWDGYFAKFERKGVSNFGSSIIFPPIFTMCNLSIFKYSFKDHLRSKGSVICLFNNQRII